MKTSTVMKIGAGVVGAVTLYLGATALSEKFYKYDSQGFDKMGFDREGFDRYGFNSDGYNRAGYDIDGFDIRGYDEQGFDCEGYDHQGYTADGYDKDGWDRRGFSRAGFDAEGFDRFGRDAEGYYRNGFDRNGYNRQGFDSQGYGRDYYSESGIDRAGRNQDQYVDLLGRLYIRLNDARCQLQMGAYRYAVSDARLVLEEALRLVVEHVKGTDSAGGCLLDNLKICEKSEVLPVDPTFIDRLHGVRHICNAVSHELDASDRLNHRKTLFVITQTHDLLKSAEKTLCCA